MNKTKSAPVNKFGTFGGVFTPSILTILGIILFMRFGWIVGNAGVLHGLLMVLIGSLITFSTSMSLSAVATNIQVKTGGAYYIISRSLGIEIGGSIGIPLFLSQAISVSFYLIGFAEAFTDTMPFIDPVYPASFMCILFAITALIGADFAIKLQYIILAALALALVSFFTGGEKLLPVLITPAYSEGHSFWTVFAIFFPAVTGIMSGVSMSGDLKNPGRSIPLGTISSVIISYIIYSLAMIKYSVSIPREILLVNKFAMKEICSFPLFFTIGVWAATLSSALASMVGAPRTLSAVAADGIIPRFFTSALGSKTEPRAAVIATFIIAQTVILLGKLDAVAPVITMFFLNTYGMLNLTAGIERLSGSPNYRPKLNMHPAFSLLAGIACYAVMFLIHTPATIAAVILSFCVYFLIKKKALSQNWGDALDGVWSSLAIFALHKLENRPRHIKNWKPDLLVFSGNPQNRAWLVNIAGWLCRGRGMITLCQIISGSVQEESKRRVRDAAVQNLKNYLSGKNIQAFCHAVIAESFQKGVQEAVQSCGIGRLKPNIAVLGMSRTGEAGMLYNLTRSVLLEKINVLALKPSDRPCNYSTIDIWWGGLGGNGALMLMLAYVISCSSDWHNCRIRVLRIIEKPEGIKAARQNMMQLINNLRIRAEAEVFPRDQSAGSMDIQIASISSTADLTILGMSDPFSEDKTVFDNRIFSFTHALGQVMMIRASGQEPVLI